MAGVDGRNRARSDRIFTMAVKPVLSFSFPTRFLAPRRRRRRRRRRRLSRCEGALASRTNCPLRTPFRTSLSGLISRRSSNALLAPLPSPNGALLSPLHNFNDNIFICQSDERSPAREWSRSPAGEHRGNQPPPFRLRVTRQWEANFRTGRTKCFQRDSHVERFHEIFVAERGGSDEFLTSSSIEAFRTTNPPSLVKSIFMSKVSESAYLLI